MRGMSIGREAVKTPAYTVRIDRCVAPLQNRGSQFGGRSSVGRAQGCGPWGRGFEPRRSPFNLRNSANWLSEAPSPRPSPVGRGRDLPPGPRHQNIPRRPLEGPVMMAGLMGFPGFVFSQRLELAPLDHLGGRGCCGCRRLSQRRGLIGKCLVDQEIIIRIGRAAAEIEVAVEVAAGLARKAGVDVGIVV